MTTQQPPLGDQLRTLRDSGKLQVHPEVINVDRVSVGEIRITSCDDRIASRLRSLNVFFMELRRKVRILTGDDSWAIRYASQVHTPLLPLLHSPHALRIIIDPMGPYRDPVKLLSDGSDLSVFELPSHAYYFMTRDQLLQNENASARLVKNINRRESDHQKGANDGSL